MQLSQMGVHAPGYADDMTILLIYKFSRTVSEMLLAILTVVDYRQVVTPKLFGERVVISNGANYFAVILDIHLNFNRSTEHITG